MSVIRVGERLIGEGQPCFIAAEVGINHNGDVEIAHRMIDVAADAGADGVKFQNYQTEDFVTDRSATYEYVSQGKTVVESQFDMFKRYELDPAVLGELREHCDRRGVVFFGTPTSDAGVADLVAARASMLKNGSDYLGNLQLLETMARTGLPTVVSTGMATLSEIDEAVRAFRGVGGGSLILLHCTSSYPTLAEDVNLRKIPVLSAAFGCPAGFSDHTKGVTASVGAMVLGACFIEKHFTLDKELPGPDHWFSADPAELRGLIDSVRSAERSLGTSAIGPTDAELGNREEFRLSCVAARDLAAGERLTKEDIAFGRPGTGFPPASAPRLVGCVLAADIPAGRLFSEKDLR
jgi:N,N'-diacetyllegionaminate synthase